MKIPGNFVDSDTGEALRPVYRFQDAVGIWHEKELWQCSLLELETFCVLLWNSWMEERLMPVPKSKKLGILDVLKVLLMTVGASTILISILILIVMFVQ